MGCCIFSLALLGAPRIAGVFWWLFRPIQWTAAFATWPGVYWIWPLLGLLALPWTTLMYVICYPGGLSFINWIFIALALVVDIASYGSGARARSAY